MTGPHRIVIRQGFLLILLALLGGIAAPFMVNSRLGVGAHTLGLFGGIILVIIGLARPMLSLDDRLWRLMHVCWLAAAYGNWATTMLAGLTGASHLTPIAGAGTTGTPLAEGIVFALYVAVGVTSIAGTAIGVFGLRPRPTSA